MARAARRARRGAGPGMEEAGRALLGRARDVEEGAAMEEVAHHILHHSVERQLKLNPGDAIQWIEGQGVRKLGSFQIQVGSRPKGMVDQSLIHRGAGGSLDAALLYF